MQVIRVIEQFHDYEPKTYYIDPSLLREDNFVENKIKEAIAKDPAAKEVDVYLHRNSCPNEDLEGGLGSHARVDADDVEPGTIANQVIWLTIRFE